MKKCWASCRSEATAYPTARGARSSCATPTLRYGSGLCKPPADGGRRPFDETQTGLDHLAFVVPNQAALRHWCDLLTDHGVAFSPIAEARSIPGAEVVVLRDPDNIQLELFARSE